jgi:hypothetical protein
MPVKRPHSTNRRWSCGTLVGLLIALTTWTSAWSLKPVGAGMHVAVHEGELSVDLRAAQMREVLAVIGQQAGLRIRVDAAADGVVDAQFTGMALDQGLRRLLRAASLSYTLLYTRGPAESIILQEVRVFGEARGEATASHDRARIGRGQRTTALVTPVPQEERVEPEATEPEEETEPIPEEPEQGTDAAQD